MILGNYKMPVSKEGGGGLLGRKAYRHSSDEGSILEFQYYSISTKLKVYIPDCRYRALKNFTTAGSEAVLATNGLGNYYLASKIHYDGIMRPYISILPFEDCNIKEVYFPYLYGEINGGIYHFDQVCKTLFQKNANLSTNKLYAFKYVDDLKIGSFENFYLPDIYVALNICCCYQELDAMDKYKNDSIYNSFLFKNIFAANKYFWCFEIPHTSSLKTNYAVGVHVDLATGLIENMCLPKREQHYCVPVARNSV